VRRECFLYPKQDSVEREDLQDKKRKPRILPVVNPYFFFIHCPCYIVPYIVTRTRKNMNIKKNMVVFVVSNFGAFIIISIMNNITIILLLVALGIFVWLAVRAKYIRSFQFQMSVFLVIWIVGGIVDSLQDSGIDIFSNLQGDGDLGSEIHVTSMILFSVMLWLRFYYSEKSGRMMVEGELGAAAGSGNSSDSSNSQES
jgi:hypothetical protein